MSSSRHDEIALQLSELMELRSVGRKLTSDESRERALAHVGPVPLEAYGSWFFFPWSKTLVHVLPRAEFRELRTHANRHKITTAEQEKLSAFTIGVVGSRWGKAPRSLWPSKGLAVRSAWPISTRSAWAT